jgi:hypothetical protein
MTTPIPDGTADMSELVDATIPRVDLVGQAANGHSFIIAKSADAPNLVPASMVRDLIAKADDEAAEPADIDLTEPLADGDGTGGDSSETDPGSAAWEAVDAATARKWTAVLQRAKHAMETLAARESTEAAVSGDWDDQSNAYDLEDAASAVDYAISVLAPFAVSEQFEAELAAELVGKAVAGLDPAALDTVEAFAPIVKAGRSLSSANEAALRSAAEAIQKVLASLPPAPDETLVKEAPVADKEPAPVAKADALVAVYTQDGELLGAVNPADLTELSTGKPAPEAAADAAGADAGAGGDAGDDAAAADAAAGDGGDADARTIPGTNTVQSPPADDGTDVTKATADAVAIAIKEAFGPIVKQLAETAQLGEVVKGLQDRVEAFGRQPDDRTSPLLNGATGLPGLASRDGNVADPLAELKKAVADATTPDAITKAKSELAYAEIRARFV